MGLFQPYYEYQCSLQKLAISELSNMTRLVAEELGKANSASKKYCH